MEDLSDFGLFDDFPDGETHPLQIDDFEEEERSTSSVVNIYKPTKQAGTALHEAIKHGKKAKIDALLAAYQTDFDKIEEYIVTKFGWDPSDKIWLKKTILVGVEEEQCHLAKRLEEVDNVSSRLSEAIFVLLRHAVNGEEVAVFVPNQDNYLDAFRLLRDSIPNGFLTWNYVGVNGEVETFMETAASRGNMDVITQLFDLGAPIAIPEHNPLIAACEKLQKKTILWLLTEHFDHFDCSARNARHYNALIVLMQRNNVDMFVFVLEKMLAYRCKYYGESESEAFNSIFRFEDEDLSSLSILTFLRTGPLVDVVEKYIVKYELDLSYQWKNVMILHSLLCRKVALDYCLAGIRDNPKLLGLIYGNDSTLLHNMVKWNFVDELQEIYAQNPTVKTYFETGEAYYILRNAISEERHEVVRFILNNHLEYLEEDPEKFKEQVICWKYYPKKFYNQDCSLCEFFPDYVECIEKTSKEILEADNVLEPIMNDLIENTTDEPIEGPTLCARGPNGETLLQMAIEKDNIQLVNRLLESGCDFDAVDNDGNHAIHYVQSVDMLNLLIDRHQDHQNLIHRTNSRGYTVLHSVCCLYKGKDALLTLLERVIECGANVNERTKNGDNAVFLIRSYSLLEPLRRHGIEIDVVNFEGETAVLRHLYQRNIWVANALLELVHKLPTFKEHAYAYLEPMIYRNRDFFSCEYQPFLEKYPETTRIIFDSIFEHSREEASRLFAKACLGAFNFVADKFLDFDYDLNYDLQDDYKYTPIIGLLSYLEEPNIHVVKKLLSRGVDLNLCNQWGRNALLTTVWSFPSAKWYGHNADTVQLLLDHGAEINAADPDGNTALHMAFSKAEWDLVELLIRNGADLRAKNNDGLIPCDIAPKAVAEFFFFVR